MPVKKPLTREEMQKKLKEATSTPPANYSGKNPDPLKVELEGKTGRPVAKSFGFEGISVAEKIKQGFNKSEAKPGEKNIVDIPGSRGFNYSYKNKWEDETYGAEPKKKKGKK